MIAREPLVAWSLATFHTVAFVLAVLSFLYASGGLAGTLIGLNTVVGFGAFLALWMTTRFTTRRALAGGLRITAGPDDFMRQALRWGAVNAWLFLVILVVAGVLAVPFVTPAGGLATVVFVVAFGIIATPFALIIGAVVGAVFGAIDAVLMSVAASIVRSCLGPP